MGARDIQTTGLILAFGPVLLSLLILAALRIRRRRDLLLSVARMAVQLWLVGVYLTWLFEWNHWAVNVGYVLLMMAVANATLLRGSGLRLRLFVHTFPALLIAIGATLAWFTVLVFVPEPLHDARYLVPVAGMLLGNSMNRSIVTLERFYTSIRRDPEGFAALVTMGATVREAATPYLRTAYAAGLAPVIAGMATMGVVSLPGMMTGQILGGSAPGVAIEYQIAIMLAILMATEIASLLAIWFSLPRSFDEYGFLRADVFSRSSRTTPRSG